MTTAKTPKAPKETVAAEKVKKAAESVEKTEKAVTAEKVEKKPAAKSAAKPAVKKVEEIFVQFGGEEWNVSQLKDAAKAAFVAEGHKASAIKKLTVYVKPEDRKAYYVVNDELTGSIDF